MEIFLIRGWDPILPGVTGLRGWPEGQLSPHADSMSPSQSAICQWGWGFHILRSGIDPEDLRFRPRVVGVVDVWKDFLSGDGPYPPRERRDLNVGARGNSHHALTP